MTVPATPVASARLAVASNRLRTFIKPSRPLLLTMTGASLLQRFQTIRGTSISSGFYVHPGMGLVAGQFGFQNLQLPQTVGHLWIVWCQRRVAYGGIEAVEQLLEGVGITFRMAARIIG